MVHKAQSSTLSTDGADKAEKLVMKSSNLYRRHNPWVIFLGFLLLPYYSQSVLAFCATGESWQWPVGTAPKQPAGFLRTALKEAQFPTGNAIMQAAIKEPFLNLSFQRNQEFQLLAVMVGSQYTCLETPNKTYFTTYIYLHFMKMAALFLTPYLPATSMLQMKYGHRHIHLGGKETESH